MEIRKIKVTPDIRVESITVTMTEREMAVIGVLLGQKSPADVSDVVAPNATEPFHAVYNTIAGVMNRFYEDGVTSADPWRDEP